MTEQTTFGNWRPARGLGVGRLSMPQLVTSVLAGLAALLTLQASGLSLASWLAMLAAGVIIAAVTVRVGSQSLADVMARRARFRSARSRGLTELSGGVLTDHPRRHDLPGPLAQLVPLSADDGRGGRQGMLWHRRSGRLTVVLAVSPLGIDLADAAETHSWVENWGAFLADLGYQPMVRHIAVTVDSHPSGGSTARQYINSRIEEDAPAAAREVMHQLIAMTPTSAADVDTRLSITFDPSRATPKPETLLDSVAEVTRWLPGIEQMLGSCGIAVRGRVSAEGLAARIRWAFDPAARNDVATADENPELVRWEDAGPIRAVDNWNYYQHDSAYSVSWALEEAPRQAVISRVLTPLLAPGPYSRRVTLVYEPESAAAAAAALEQEVRNVSIRRAIDRRTKKEPTERDHADERAARQGAMEEAEGAGVGRFTVYVSTSVAQSDGIDAAMADVEQRAGQAKLRLRCLRGAQAGGFAAALGMGINPGERQ